MQNEIFNTSERIWAVYKQNSLIRQATPKIKGGFKIHSQGEWENVKNISVFLSLGEHKVIELFK